jgi:hypothetical protein
MRCPDGTAPESQPHSDGSSPETTTSAGSATTQAPTPSTTSNPRANAPTSHGTPTTGAPHTDPEPADPEAAPTPDATAPATTDARPTHPTNHRHGNGDHLIPGADHDDETLAHLALCPQCMNEAVDEWATLADLEDQLEDEA